MTDLNNTQVNYKLEVEEYEILPQDFVESLSEPDEEGSKVRRGMVMCRGE